jgi:hypothetical protein
MGMFDKRVGATKEGTGHAARVTLLSLVMSAALMFGSGCAVAQWFGIIPQESDAERLSAERQRKLDAMADGECQSAELCRDFCEEKGRPIDCLRAGHAYRNGQQVDYAAGWKERGDDYVYEEASSEMHHMDNSAVMAYEKSCAGNLAEGCRWAGNMHARRSNGKNGSMAIAIPFFEKACRLKDEQACTRLSKEREGDKVEAAPKTE